MVEEELRRPPAKGWTEQQTVSQSGNSPMEMLNFTKEDRTVMVMLTADQGKTVIMLQTARNQ
jgi:DNA replication initiation complex subunit (GINS family)